MTELSYPGDLTDSDALAVQLSTTGLSVEACASKARLFAKAASMLSVTGDTERGVAPLAFFAPGRVELLGKHTDYAGGRALVAAIEHGMSMVAYPRNDQKMVVIDARNGETVHFRIGPDSAAASWAAYPVMVARRVAQDFPGYCRGANVAMVSDLPPNAGLGCSTALMVGIFSILSEINQLPARDEYWHNIGNKNELAGYLGAIKAGCRFGKLNGGEDRGVFGGSEDPIGVLCSEPNHISQYAFCPIEFERSFLMPHDHILAIGASGVLPESPEQTQMPARLAAALLDLWRRETGDEVVSLAAALCSSPDAPARLHAMIETSDPGPWDRGTLASRLDHFILESGELIPEIHDALAANDLRAFGKLVDRSQEAAAQLLGNQTPETMALAASARRLGAVAASSFGVGFGGSVWAMVETDRADDFLTSWADEYRSEFAQHTELSKFFLTSAGPAAFHVC